MKWHGQHKAVKQALLSHTELQTLYQRAHTAESIHPQRLLEQPQLGDIASRYRGSGLDYEDSRLYQAGDEPRLINWRLTARSGKTQLKQFREERRPAVFILLDQRATMRFGTRVRLKITQAARLTALIAFAAEQYGWAVTAVRLDIEQVHWFPSSTDSHAIWQFVQDGASACPPSEVNKATAKATSLHDILAIITRQLSRGTYIYLLSDFMDLDKSCEALLQQLNAHHPVFGLHIIDPIELELPNAGQVFLYDQQHYTKQAVDLSNQHLRHEFKQQAADYQYSIKQQLQSAACEYYALLTTEDTPEQHIPLPQGLGA